MRVVKIGGRAQGDPLLFDELAAAWRGSPSLCIVHGGGDEVSRLQRLMGVDPQFVGGRRVTAEADIDILRMGLSGSSNKRIVAELRKRGVRSVGISGEDGVLIGARPADDRRLGLVGTPERVDVGLLHTLMDSGYLPVISPLGCSLEDGAALNINGDDAAAAVAAALRSDELLLIADVPGVMDAGVAIPHITADGVKELIDGGRATGGMVAKLESALHALRSGVRSVRIGAREAVNVPGAGTTISLAVG